MMEANANNIYWIDKKMKIVSISGPWDEFAEKNNGPDIVSEKVRGKHVWEFITGDTTRMWFDALIQLARVKRVPIERPYRCDSPRLKRYMNMTITPEDSGLLRIEHTLISTQELQTPVNFTFAREKNTEPIHTRCSVCGRVKNSQLWQETADRGEEEEINMNVTYAVCPDCR